MVVRKKVEEQASVVQEEIIPNVEEKPAMEVSCSCKDNRTKDDIDLIEKKKALISCMIDKAHDLLKSAGDGSGELKIKQIEKAIEIYKAIHYA
jgi:hypothetical protein